jgi:NAD(P)H-flavin reductase
VVAKRLFIPTQHKLPPKEKLDLFRADCKLSALEQLEKDADGRISLKLKTKIKISSDTYIFRFEFPKYDMCLGLPVGNHVMFAAKIGDEEVVRKYTPISDVKD